MNSGGKTLAFRPVPEGAIDTIHTKGTVDYLAFNMSLGSWLQYGVVEWLGLNERAMFGGKAPATGLFFAVLANRRTLCVQVDRKPNVRCWLSGQECGTDRAIRLKPGFYPFLMEYRAVKAGDKRVLPLRFLEVADPDTELARWYASVTRNADFLRPMAASGAKGACAREALEALEQHQNRKAGKARRAGVAPSDGQTVPAWRQSATPGVGQRVRGSVSSAPAVSMSRPEYRDR